MKKILVIGSSNIDFIMKMERLPMPGETVTDAIFMQTYGGKGANQAVSAAKAGGDVWFVSCVGRDNFGKLFKQNLGNLGVHVESVFEHEGTATGSAVIMIDQAGENCISVAPGANYQLTPEKLATLGALFRDAAVVVLQYEILPETLAQSVEMANQLGKPVIFNLAPARPLDAGILKKLTYLIVNETEAQHFCGFPVCTLEDVHWAARELLNKGAKNVIITLGAQGAFVARSDRSELIQGFLVEAVDTTAAGDVFCGALAVRLVEGVDINDAVVFANAASAICVTRLGAQPSIPDRTDIEAFISEYQSS